MPVVEKFGKLWPDLSCETDFGRCKNCDDDLTGREVACIVQDLRTFPAVSNSPFLCCRCLALSLNGRGYDWPAYRGHEFQRYVFVSPRKGRRGGNSLDYTEVELVPRPEDPMLDPIRISREELMAQQKEKRCSEDEDWDKELRRMCVTHSFISGNGDVDTFSYDLDASEDGWMNTSEDDIKNICASQTFFSPYVFGKSAHLTPDFPPVQCPPEQVIFGLEEDERPANRVLFSLATGEIEWDGDMIKVNPDFASQYWSSWVASEVLLRPWLEHPSYLQNMFGDIVETQSVDTFFHHLLSMCNIAPSKGFSTTKQAESAVQHAMESMDLPEDGLVVLGGDNFGLSKKRGYDQWTVLYLMVILKHVLVMFNLHNTSTYSDVEHDTWDEWLSDNEGEIADTIPDIQDVDVERMTAFDLVYKQLAMEMAKKIMSTVPGLQEKIENTDSLEDLVSEMRTLVCFGSEEPSEGDLYHVDPLAISSVPLQTDLTSNIVTEEDVEKLLKLGRDGGWFVDTTVNIARPFGRRDEEDDEDFAELEEAVPSMVGTTPAGAAAEPNLENGEGEEGEDEEDEGEEEARPKKRRWRGWRNLLDINSLKLLPPVHRDLALSETIAGIAKGFAHCLNLYGASSGASSDNDGDREVSSNGDATDSQRPFRLQEHVGALIGMDNDPTADLHSMRDKSANGTAVSRLIDMVWPFGGPFHHDNMSMRAESRANETVLGHWVRESGRNLQDAWNWIMYFGDPNNRARYQAIIIQARNVARTIALALDGKEDLSPVDIHDHALARARAYPVCMMLLMHERHALVHMMYKLAERKGPLGFELFLSSMRWSQRLFAGGHHTGYIWSTFEILKRFANGFCSELRRRVYMLFLFTKMTVGGHFIAFDLNAEKIIEVHRGPMGKKYSRGSEAKMEQTTATAADRLRMRKPVHSVDKPGEEKLPDRVKLLIDPDNEEEVNLFWIVLLDSLRRRLDGNEAPLLGKKREITANSEDNYNINGELLSNATITHDSESEQRVSDLWKENYVRKPNQQPRKDTPPRIMTTPEAVQKMLNRELIRTAGVDHTKMAHHTVITRKEIVQKLGVLRGKLAPYNVVVPSTYDADKDKAEKLRKDLVKYRKILFKKDPNAKQEAEDEARRKYSTKSTEELRGDQVERKLYALFPALLNKAIFTDKLSIIAEGDEHAED